jgi:site-specific DNA recombinase
VKKELYKRGIRTRKGSLIWADSTIQRILTNEAYTGRGYYNRTQSVETETGKKYKKALKTGKRLRDRKEWIPIRFPKIIDEEKFRLVQELLKKRFKPFGKAKNLYLLSGLVKCARCGYNFCGEGKGGSLSYYRCNNRHRKYPLPKTCDARMIRSRELDDAVWEAVVKAVTNKGILISHIKQLANKLEENEKELEERSRKLKEKLDKISQKKERLIELYTDGVIGKDEVTAKVKSYEKGENEIIKEIAEIDMKKKQVSLKPKMIENLEKFCKIMKERISSLTQEQKRQFIRYLVEKVVLDSNERIAKVIGHIPTKINEELFLQSKSGILSMPSWNHGQYPSNHLKFELEVKI